MKQNEKESAHIRPPRNLTTTKRSKSLKARGNSNNNSGDFGVLYQCVQTLAKTTNDLGVQQKEINKDFSTMLKKHDERLDGHDQRMDRFGTQLVFFGTQLSGFERRLAVCEQRWQRGNVEASDEDDEEEPVDTGNFEAGDEDDEQSDTAEAGAETSEPNDTGGGSLDTGNFEAGVDDDDEEEEPLDSGNFEAGVDDDDEEEEPLDSVNFEAGSDDKESQDIDLVSGNFEAGSDDKESQDIDLVSFDASTFDEAFESNVSIFDKESDDEEFNTSVSDQDGVVGLELQGLPDTQEGVAVEISSREDGVEVSSRRTRCWSPRTKICICEELEYSLSLD